MKEITDLIRSALECIFDALTEVDEGTEIPVDAINYLYDADNALRFALDSLPQAE
jgi:hypothetical protein